VVILKQRSESVTHRVATDSCAFEVALSSNSDEVGKLQSWHPAIILHENNITVVSAAVMRIEANKHQACPAQVDCAVGVTSAALTCAAECMCYRWAGGCHHVARAHSAQLAAHHLGALINSLVLEVAALHRQGRWDRWRCRWRRWRRLRRRTGWRTAHRQAPDTPSPLGALGRLLSLIWTKTWESPTCRWPKVVEGTCSSL
jgi:hypothetical protein